MSGAATGWLLVPFCLLALVFGCAQSDYHEPKAGGLSSNASAVGGISEGIDSAAIGREYFRLAVIMEKRNLTSEDLEGMGYLTKGDPELHDEYEEALWMATHGYARHAGHSLSSIYHSSRGDEAPCPFHPLSHVGAFLAYNETGMAQDAADEAEGALPEWERGARATKAEKPETYPNLESVIASMEREIDAFRRGDMPQVENESAYLDENGYC